MTDSKELQPAFYGVLEVTSFLALFLSPFLWDNSRIDWWLSLVCWRSLALGLVFLPGRLYGRRGTDVLRIALVYQVPFWCSALIFPLGPGQSGFAMVALAFQGVLVALLVLLCRWLDFFTAESWLYVVCFSWTLFFRPWGWWIFWAVVGLGFTFKYKDVRPIGARYTPWGLGLSIATVWLVGVALTSLISELDLYLGSYICLGSLWIYLANSLMRLQQSQDCNIEIELTLRGMIKARRWLNFRYSAILIGGWMANLFILVDNSKSIWASLVLILAWCRGVELLSKRLIRTPGFPWWVSIELSLIWAVIMYPIEAIIASLSLLALALSCQIDGEAKRLDPPSRGIASIERLLTRNLTYRAPPDFAHKLVVEARVSKFDDQLSSTAPSGFSQRLLERLRKDKEKKI